MPAGRRPARRPPDGRPDALVEIGRIVGRHGVRGELRVLPHNPNSTVLHQLPEVVLRAEKGATIFRKVVSARRHKQCVLVRLDGVETADNAAALIGQAVHVRASDLPPARSGEIYYRDLVGCAVRTAEGENLGRISEVFDTGSNDVCVVRRGKSEHFIPLIADVVVELDVTRREVVIRPLPGLLDP